MSDEQIKKLEARIAELEAKVNPPPPAPSKPWHSIDLTEQMAVPVRLTGREVYRDQSLAEANMEYSKDRNPVGTLRPLAEFLNKGPVAEPPPASVAATVPIDNKVPGQDLMDRIAQGFAERERAEELAKLVDVANKLRGL